MTAPRLFWRQVGDGVFHAAVGEEAQGRAGVRRARDGWRWWLDMLPDDAEPAIFSDRPCATAAAAMERAEAQAAAWPALIPGARR
jgi:hypothetical protein